MEKLDQDLQRRVWQRVTDSINQELEKIKLSDMLNQQGEREETHQ